jgi:hypothetical protein
MYRVLLPSPAWQSRCAGFFIKELATTVVVTYCADNQSAIDGATAAATPTPTSVFSCRRHLPN